MLSLSALSAVSPDGRTLTVAMGVSSCGRLQGAGINVYETGGVVVLGGWVRSQPLPPDTACAASAMLGTFTVHLARPLASRVVLDADLAKARVGRRLR